MVDVAHATLANTFLHEPKDINTALANTVYVANGSGSGTWTSSGVFLGIAGMVADFAVPIAPTGWLECDGLPVSRATYSNLFSAVSITQTGVRATNSKIITGLTDTVNMKPGYFVSGTNITAGSTITTVDSTTQITLSVNGGTGITTPITVSPFPLGDGSTTFNLPDAKSSGRYRRSRTATVQMGTVQGDLFKQHSHTVNGASGNTGGQSAGHTHTQGGTFTSTGQSADHTHSISVPTSSGSSFAAGPGTSVGSVATGGTSVDHTHSVTISGETGGVSAGHTHTVTIDNSPAATETRPLSIVVMTCIKT